MLFTSEPVTHVAVKNGCVLVGRFTIRRGDSGDRARRLVSASAGARSLAWASWNAKGTGQAAARTSYIRIADWLWPPSRHAGCRSHEVQRETGVLTVVATLLVSACRSRALCPTRLGRPVTRNIARHGRRNGRAPAWSYRPNARGRVVQVKAGDDLQAALDAAAPGDHITLDAGATLHRVPFAC